MMDKSLLMNLNGPWSNTACMGYCLIAMRRAGVNVKTQDTMDQRPDDDAEYLALEAKHAGQRLLKVMQVIAETEELELD